MAKNFPNLGKETDIQVQKTEKIPNKMHPKRFTQNIIFNFCHFNYNLKGRNRRQLITYKGNPIRLSADFFSAEILQARRELQDIFKVL